MVDTDLRGADLFGSDIRNTLFAPLFDTVPTVRGVARFIGVGTLTYPKDPPRLSHFGKNSSGEG